MLVLEDLHAADTPSLLLLEFVAGELAGMRVLVVATYRDVDPTLDYPLVATLTQLARHPTVRTVPLRGLSQGEVGDFLEGLTGTDPDRAVVAAIHRETEGNPLFVGEIARLLMVEGALAHPSGDEEWRPAIPDEVREVIDRRLARLAAPCLQALTTASVVGREFDPEVLARLVGRGVGQTLTLLEPAVAARVLSPVPGASRRLRFAHALIRDALYEGLPAGHRMELHRQVAEMLEALAADGPPLAEMAHHYDAAGEAADAERASEFAERAADRALGQLAYEEAVRLYRIALRSLDRAEGRDQPRRCELLLSLGDARMRAGDGPGSKETFLAAARVAASSGSPAALARAALGYGGRFVWVRAGDDPHLVPLLREALEGLGDEGSILRARILARLAGALRDEPTRDRRDALSREAVAVARRLGDPSTTAFALVSRYTAIWGPDNTDELLAIADEVVRLGAEAREPDRVLEGHLLRHAALTILGHMEAARAELEEAGRLADDLRQALGRWYVASYRTTLLLLEGRLGEAERMGERTLQLGQRAERMGAEVAFRLQRYVLRREQGRLEEVEPLIRQSVGEFPWYPLFRCVLAHLLALLGRGEEAGRLLDELAEGGFAAIPMDNEWLFAMCFLAEVAHEVDDADRADALTELLAPFAALNAVSHPEVSVGPVSRYLGLLAAASGRRNEAARHLEDAIARSERTGARAWAARARSDLARALVARDGPGDRERAEGLAAEAREESRRLGMAALLRELGSSEATDRPRAASRTHPTVFRREGEYRSIAFEGAAFRLRETKGLGYLARLLASPGREIHVLDLVVQGGVPTGGGGVEGLRATREGTTGEILDATARTAYRRRIEELQDQIDEAESFGDVERAGRAREELDFLARELAGATGLGGRGRRSASAAERARQSVTKAIKVAVGRISAESPTLGRHLTSTIRTGTFCGYHPDPRAPIAWDL